MWCGFPFYSVVFSHVSPSFQFGYAPSCYTYARVLPVGEGGSVEGLTSSPPEGAGAFSQRNRDYDLVTKEGIVEALQVWVRLGCYLHIDTTGQRPACPFGF